MSLLVSIPSGEGYISVTFLPITPRQAIDGIVVILSCILIKIYSVIATYLMEPRSRG